MHIEFWEELSLEIILHNDVYFLLFGLLEWNVLLIKQAACIPLHSDVSNGNNRVTEMGSQQE